jgi:hypothetical protein
LSSDSQMKLKFLREKEFNYANLSELIRCKESISDFSSRFSRRSGLVVRFSGRISM